MNTNKTTPYNIDKEEYVDAEHYDLVKYWVLKTILDLGASKEFFHKRGGFDKDEVAHFLDLSEYVDEDEIVRSDILKLLKSQYRALNKKTLIHRDSVLEKNLKKISKLLSLNKIEQDILRFTILTNNYEVLEDASDMFGDVRTTRVYKLLGTLLGYSKKEIQISLSPVSKLIKSGLVSVSASYNRSLSNQLDMLSDNFGDMMINFDGAIDDLISDSVSKCTKNTLTNRDYAHIKDDVEIIKSHLKKALSLKQNGVNILLYGRAGTGKTELTKVIANSLKSTLYEINYTDDSGEAIEGKERLKAYSVANALFVNKKALLMFDEIEDVFRMESRGFFDAPRQANKAWINRMLESNTTPTIWITNNINSIDEAIIRRFDFSLEVPIPSKKKRVEIIKKSSKGMLDIDTIEKLARSEDISPAIITKAIDVAKNISNGKIDSKVVENIIDNTIIAQGYNSINKISIDPLPKGYNPNYINCDEDLEYLVDGISQNQNARLCLYGAPGTGKSAFGKYISDRLNRPLHLKKGSDLMSMYVGGTEKNIARAFNEAKEDKAVLVFDEVDSFLQDRQNAKQSWEVTQVNEMLTQMENYNGIFIATTNLMDGLDPASLRRFDMKMQFNYLDKKQRVAIFEAEAKSYGIKKVSSRILDMVSYIDNLTPGDFATIRRQSKFRAIKSDEKFYDSLIQESERKNENSSKKMGFLR